MNGRQRAVLIGLGVSCAISGICAFSIGAVTIPPSAWSSLLGLGGTHTAQQEAVLFIVRFPRVILALLAGAALAVGGAAMQALFRNPLADPSIIGISSGAGLSAALAITATTPLVTLVGAWAGPVALPVLAFTGALLSASLVFGIARDGRRANVGAMLLAGIGITAIAGALTGLLTYTASNDQLRSITFWLLGSLGGADRNAVIIMCVAVPVPLWMILRSHRQLNALALGEQQARYLGVDAERIKRRVVLATSVMVGATVALCGVIGFIGLVVPHVLRMIGGVDNRFLLPASMLGGALLLCLADTLARTMVAPAEIPIGVITALCGAPVFLALLVRRKRSLVL
ncbi:MAG: iron chelate uptake ABC transporter family permease subunit [Flavobacteriales bacterium]